LLVWFGSTFIFIFFARELSNINFFGWPLSFYLAAQGSVVLYAIIVAIYALKMHVLDKIVENDDKNGK